MNLLSRIVVVFCCIMLLSGCSESYEFVGSTLRLADSTKVNEDKILFDSVGRFYFSRLENSGMGMFTNISIPEKNRDKQLWVVFEGKVRSNLPFSMGTISLHGSNDKGEVLNWEACFLRYSIIKPNQWCRFKDSIFLKSRLNFHEYNSINVFSLLGNSPGEKFDIDSLLITVKEIKRLL